MNGAVFLDRDGVINQELGDYVQNIADFKVQTEIIPAIIHWKNAGLKLIVVTNQGGIAKGLYTIQDVWEMHHIFQRILSNHEIQMDDIYICPHHPEKSRCLCRKPLPGMLLHAIAKHQLDPGKCIMIGDTERDILAAEGAGVKGFRVRSNHPEDVLKIADTTYLS